MAALTEDYPAGWLTHFRRGVVAGLSLLAAAAGVASVPTLLIWLIPGGDTASGLAAVKAAVIVVLAGNHGGLVLDGTAVSLAPLSITILLAWLLVSAARRAESTSGFVGLVGGYALGSVLLARWAQLGATYAPLWRSALGGLALAAIAGGCGRYADRGWERVPGRWQGVFRASGAVVALYLLAGSGLAAGALTSHFQDAVVMQRHIAPGAAGVPVALLGMAAAPNAVVAAVGYLAGPGFKIGSNSSVSMFSVSHGRLPVFPLLGAVPTGAPVTAFGVTVGVVLALVAGWIVFRTARAQTGVRRLEDAAAIAALVGGAFFAFSALANGAVGDGSLQSIGTSGWAVGGSLILLVLCGGGVCSAADGAIAWAAGRGVRAAGPSVQAAGGDERAAEPSEQPAGPDEREATAAQLQVAVDPERGLPADVEPEPDDDAESTRLVG